MSTFGYGRGKKRLGGGARGRACVAMRAERARARGAWRVWRRMRRGCPEARAESGYSLARRATVVFVVQSAVVARCEEWTGTDHVLNGEIGIRGVRHTQRIISYACMPLLLTFPEALAMHNAQAVIKQSVRWRREKTGNTIFGRSFSSLACSYSVSMLRAARKKSVGCEISKSDDRDMARTAKRWVLCRGTQDQPSVHTTTLQTKRKGSGGQTHLFFISVLVNTRSSSTRDTMIV
jgi:hypothetical protein